MPFFKTTKNILQLPDQDELFDPNWMDSNSLITPPTTEWDYSRELHVEDVEVWEVLYEATGGMGVYAAWSPFAEYYMITNGFTNHYKVINGFIYPSRVVETYYGPGSQREVENRAKQLGMLLGKHAVWIHPNDMWLYDQVV